MSEIRKKMMNQTYEKRLMLQFGTESSHGHSVTSPAKSISSVPSFNFVTTRNEVFHSSTSFSHSPSRSNSLSLQFEEAENAMKIDPVSRITNTSNCSFSKSPGYKLPPNENIYCDRFIPFRQGNLWDIKFAMDSEETSLPENSRDNTSTPKKRKDVDGNSDSIAYTCLLKNELLGLEIEDIRSQTENVVGNTKPDNLFKFTSPSKVAERPTPHYVYSVSAKSQKLLKSPRKITRRISRVPFKVLDAPELQDDFYLNLVDWSSQNVLGVGLGSCVYMWSARTSQVSRLCDVSTEGNSVTSVAWNDKGNLLAIGTHFGYVQIWDVTTNKRLNHMIGHSARIGSLAWNGDTLTSGSRDRLILQRDIRTPTLAAERKLTGHRQEVCGLKWSPDNQYLASGGNDNRLLVWNLHSPTPVQTYSDHNAAVKAIAWSPHHHGLLASGGGTADRCIRFWNTLTGQPMQVVDTGSQVCNLAWSKHSSELVSTHGYSQNQIVVWKYPSLSQVAKLTGHSYRVLYLAMSPDGEAIVTGAGDETLRFWNVFSKARSQKENKSVLNLISGIR